MTPDQQGLLHALAFLYLRHRQYRRALTLILLAARNAPDDIGIMRTLAYAFIANDAPEEALEVIERLETLDFAAGADQARLLIKARALLHAGRRVEAKAVFREFVSKRKVLARAPAEKPDDTSSNDVIPDVGKNGYMPSKRGFSGSLTPSASGAGMT